MQISLRPYLTAGVAIAGASVIAVTPIQPTLPDVQISNPAAAVSRDVQLTGVIDDAVNQAVFFLVATPTVRGTEIFLVPIAEAILPEDLAPLAASLPLVSLGFVGPLIAGPGAIGTALQDVVDGFGDDFGTGLLATIGAPATIIDGFVNGGYGPNLFPLVGDLLPLPPLVPIGPPALGGCTNPVPSNTCIAPTYTVLAGGLINQASVDTILGFIPANPLSPLLPSSIGVTTILPGTFPTLQTLVGALLEAVDIGGLLDPPALQEQTSVSTFKSANEESLVTLDVAPDSGGPKGKDTAPDLALAGPPAGLPGQAGNPAKQVRAVLDSATQPGRELGANIAAAAKPDRATGSTTVERPSVMFAPPTTPGDKSGDAKSGAAPGRTISGIAKNIGDSVRNALGGGGSTSETE